jgi:hypothetical protein
MVFRKLLVVSIVVIALLSVNCSEDISPNRLETARGDDSRELVYDPEDDWDSWLFHPTLSPDASSVAFNVDLEESSYAYGLVVLNFLTMDTELIRNEHTERPKWSPSGEWIAYTTGDGPGVCNIYLIRPDGSDIRPAVSDGASWDAMGRWLNNEDILVYLRHGLTEGEPGGYNLTLYDIVNDTTIYLTEFDDRSYSNPLGVSPDDEWIAGSQIPHNYEPGWGLQLSYVRSDGSDYRVEIRESYLYHGAQVLDWSPCGKYLLFSIRFQICSYDDYELWTYEIKTGEFKQLTMARVGYSRPNPPHNDVTHERIEHAEWGPDGYVYFMEAGKLYRIEAPL